MYSISLLLFYFIHSSFYLLIPYPYLAPPPGAAFLKDKEPNSCCVPTRCVPGTSSALREARPGTLKSSRTGHSCLLAYFCIPAVKALVLVLIPFSPRTYTGSCTPFWLPLVLFPALHSDTAYQRDFPLAKNLWETLYTVTSPYLRIPHPQIQPTFNRKIFGRKDSRKFQKAKLEFVVHGRLFA